jgi:hypothetical protein
MDKDLFEDSNDSEGTESKAGPDIDEIDSRRQ